MIGRKIAQRTLYLSRSTFTLRCACAALSQCHPDFTRPWAVELAQVNCLPCTELQAAVADKNLCAGTHHAGLDMGRGISFAVAIIRRCPWHGFVECVQYVRHNVRVGVFVDGDSGGRVRDKDGAQAVLDAGFGHGLLYFACDVDELIALAGTDNELFHFKPRLQELMHNVDEILGCG